MPAPKQINYRVLVGMNYVAGGKEVRREAGDIADDIPFDSIRGLLNDGHIAALEAELPVPIAPPRETSN